MKNNDLELGIYIGVAYSIIAGIIFMKNKEKIDAAIDRITIKAIKKLHEYSKK